MQKADGEDPELYDQYHNNQNFKDYVDAYCKSRGLGTFEALGHITVKEVAKYYKTKNADIIPAPGQQASCDTRR